MLLNISFLFYKKTPKIYLRKPEFLTISETAQKVLKFGSIEIKYETTNQTDINEAIAYLTTLLGK